ncbi:MAG: hypothetical protein IH949_11130 [Bacteroidetes bacterium]|nr:hypothetical protein [Bacteroidota bacterium]
MQLLGKQFDDETLYPMVALKRSKKVSYLLNNFSDYGPSLINFFVCKYDCKNALNIVKKIFDFVKQKMMNIPRFLHL